MLESVKSSLVRIVDNLKDMVSPFEVNGEKPKAACAGNEVSFTNMLDVFRLVETDINELLTLNYIYNVPVRKNLSVVPPSSLPKPAATENEVVEPVTNPGVVKPLLGTIGGLIGSGPLQSVGKLNIIPPSTG
jgi:hypothetical protein